MCEYGHLAPANQAKSILGTSDQATRETDLGLRTGSSGNS